VDRLVEMFGAVHREATLRLANDRRSGFVKSANRGMRASARDVVLLNSDTAVTPNWLEQLVDAATSTGDAGTVTPFSNHATLCSIPEPFRENLLPSGLDVPSFARLIESVSQRAYPRLPTGVGMCLYIRRELINDIGLFDEHRFGFGYGEENDFCFCAIKRGWLNLLDDATFIYHAGEGSFSHSAASARRRAARVLHRIHPEYYVTIASFMKNDPVAPVRERITARLRARDPKAARRRPDRIAHLVHGWPPFQHGGTELYAKWLVDRQVRWRDVVVYARFDAPSRRKGDSLALFDAGARVQLVVNNFVQRNPLSRNAIADPALDRHFARFLIEEKPDLLHIHHLAGHAFSLSHVARKLRIPIVYQIQDWWTLCARVNLFDRYWKRCTGPAIAKCSRCAPLTAISPAPVWNRALHIERRTKARKAFEAADAYVMGSEFIRNDYTAAGLLNPSKPVFVVPYGIDLLPSQRPRAVRTGPIRFGYVGSILPHKGLHIAVEAFSHLVPSEAELQLWGDARISPEYTETLKAMAGTAAISFRGTFDEKDKTRVFASIDVLLVPSVGLESFGLAAREAMACGVPVIAADDGALRELLTPGSAGALFESGNPGSLRAILETIVRSPQIIEAWSAALPQPKHFDRHAEEIEDVYAAVLAARR
jgi:glycosyltransferase involved in cell wall biosynthesis/GT2 family glycosyltransferase